MLVLFGQPGDGFDRPAAEEILMRLHLAEELFVVSVDAVGIPRIIYKDLDAKTCQQVANDYDRHKKAEGERLCITCIHDDLTLEALDEHSVN